MNMRKSMWQWVSTSSPGFRRAQQRQWLPKIAWTVRSLMFSNSVTIFIQNGSLQYTVIWNWYYSKEWNFVLLVSLPTTAHHWLREGVKHSKEMLCCVWQAWHTRHSTRETGQSTAPPQKNTHMPVISAPPSVWRRPSTWQSILATRSPSSDSTASTLFCKGWDQEKT